MFFPVICQTFIKFSVLLGRNFICRPCPDGFSFVKLFVFSVFLLDLLFLLISIFFIGIFILSNIFNLWFFLCFIFLLFFNLIITDFFLSFLLNHQLDGISNKLRVFLDNFLYFLFLQIFRLVLFHLQNNLGASAKRFTVILFDGKRSSCG